MNKEEFIKECKNINIEIDINHIEKFDKYLELLKKWNSFMNLTGIIEETEVYLKHYYDSLYLIKAANLNENLLLCDVGTGAGFPGIVLKIVFPNLKIILLEPIKKRCNFLEEVIKMLELKEIEVVCERAEIYSKNNRERFDIITCRAVSNLKIISEISIPMLKVNGLFLPLKGRVKEEIKESKDILKKLSSNVEKVIEYKLPEEKSVRSIPVIRKYEKTSNLYPRNYNTIIK